jgi:hypothetical protein
LKAVGILKAGSIGPGPQWRRALEFWQIPWFSLSVKDISGGALDRCFLLIVEEVQNLPHAALEALHGFLQGGGNLVICAQAPKALLSLAGVRSIEPRRKGAFARRSAAAARRACYRCVMVSRIQSAVGRRLMSGFRPGEVLFFTNSRFNEKRPGRDFSMKLDASASVIATTWEACLKGAAKDSWDEGKPTREPTIVTRQAFSRGGFAIYCPIPLGWLTLAKQAEVVGVFHSSYQVENDALLLLMRCIIRFAAEAAEEPLGELCLWPGGARAWSALSGDVHEYIHHPPLHERREYSFLAPMANMMRQCGFERAYTFCVTGRVAEQHPEEFAALRGWDVVAHGFDDESLLGWPVRKQMADARRCIEAFQKVLPAQDSFRLGWRTHVYGSDAVTRQALAKLGYKWISDMGRSWRAEWDFKRYRQARSFRKAMGRGGFTAFACFPQRAVGPAGTPLKLWEMPESGPNDYAIYESGLRAPEAEWAVAYSPAEAQRVWQERFERALSREEFFLLNWHPYLTLKDRGRTRVARLLASRWSRRKRVKIGPIGDAASWWEARQSVRVAWRRKGISARVENRSNAPLKGMTIRMLLPRSKQVRTALVSGKRAAWLKDKDGRWVMVTFHLPARGQADVELRLEPPQPQ